MKQVSPKDSLMESLNTVFAKEVSVHFSSDFFCITSEGTENAINSFDNDREEVKVTNWFNDYCFFIKILFLSTPNNKLMPFASVSFFQKTENTIKQLFRAEWDSYPSDKAIDHPQPHWHFTAQLSDVLSLNELDDVEEENLFNQMAGNSKTINLDRVHFAMAGNWIDDGRFVYKDNNRLVSWLVNLFSHVRYELEYKDRE